MKDQLLYSTQELFSSYLQGKKYCIPEYQRGYKWDTEDINRLLKDIADFAPNNDLDLFYCLQNITLVEANEHFSVVDGQQRLTTLTIILSYLGEYTLIGGKLQYKIRESTEEFLGEYIYNTSSNLCEIADWDALLKKSASEGKDYDYQDIYYLFNAYKTVQAWFESYPDQREVMRNKFLSHVKVIVNRPKNIDEQTLFENLNGKRVPLDGADLIRALIITRVAKAEIGDMDDSTKQSVLINEQRVKIGLLLDNINLWWAEANKQTYFQYFARKAKVVGTHSVAFNDKVLPINNLYRLYTLVHGDGKMSMDYFEKRSTDPNFLHELQTLQRTIENWYNDQELYHLILFTMLYASDSNTEKGYSELTFKVLYETWTSMPRRAFIGHLKARISNTYPFDELVQQTTLTDEDNAKQAHKESWYEAGKLVPVCTLLDIICILSSQDKSKLPARHFRAYKEDLEHIFPQTPIGNKITDTAKQTTILKDYIAMLNKLKPEGAADITLPDPIDWEADEWKADINAEIAKAIPINSLGNMCVLHESVNRGYGNDHFLEKRIDIMRKAQQGCFIRPHVYEAFNKIHLERSGQSINIGMMSGWSSVDILSRRKYIINQLHQFLNP